MSAETGAVADFSVADVFESVVYLLQWLLLLRLLLLLLLEVLRSICCCFYVCSELVIVVGTAMYRRSLHDTV